MIASLLMQQNPFMLYAGEEYGEPGMDKEGFSGNDGRTTIFDYWSVDTLVRAANRRLTQEEKTLKAVYDKVLGIAATEKAVVEGVSFDLMYVNGHYHHQYAFLRKAGSELLLIVANFDDIQASVDITIPGHAFDYLKIKEKNVQTTDLMTGAKLKLTLKRDAAVTLSVPPLGAVVLKCKA